MVKIKAFDALEIEIVEVLSEEILLFDDTKIEVWECVFNTEYRLQDGTELQMFGGLQVLTMSKLRELKPLMI